MPNRYFLRSHDLPDQLEDFHLEGVVRLDGVVSLIVSSSNSDGAGLCPLSEQDRKNLIDALSSPERLKEIDR